MRLGKQKKAEAKQWESEEHFRTMADGAPIMLWMTDAKGNVLFHNKQWRDFAGLSEDEMTGESWLERLHPEDRQHCTDNYVAAMKEQREFQLEYRLRRFDGVYRWMMDRGVPQISAGGTFLGYIGSCIDITDRKEAETALKTRMLQQAAVTHLGVQALSGTGLSQLFNEAVNSIVKNLDIEYSKVLELLPDGKQMLLKAGSGWQAGLVGQATVGAGADSQAGYTLLSQYPVVVENLRTETRFTGPQLLVEHKVVSGMSVIIGKQERPYGVLGAHSTRKRLFTEDDINFLQAVANVLGEVLERKQAEAALFKVNAELERRVEERTDDLYTANKILQSEVIQREQAEEVLRRYEHIISTTSELMTFVDKDYIYQAANQSFLNTFGKTQKEVIGHSVRDVSGQEYFNTILKPNLDRSLRGNKTKLEIWSNFPNMDRRCFEMSFDPHINKDGQVAGVVITSHDITEHKQVEMVLRDSTTKAEAANVAKSQFLANMSHELRTPLNAIIGYSELLKETAEIEQRQQDLTDLENIHTAGKHLLSLIDDILDLAKIEAGKLELMPVQFEISSLLDAVVSSVMPMIDKNGNILTVQCGDTVASMYADEARLRQCLLNLMSNAAKFTEGGEITLVVDYEQKDSIEWLNFQVSDTGIGMSNEQLAKVMQPFAQADTSTTRKYGGSGLGLAITCELVGMMGGEINVESAVGKGSKFTLLFPREPVSVVSAG